MASLSSIERQYLNPSQSLFTSPNGISLDNDTAGYVLDYLLPEELARTACINKCWQKFDTTEQWKRQCQILLNISTDVDPTTILPVYGSYKKIFEFVHSKIYDGHKYQYYLGAKTESAPPIPEAIALKKWNEPDPCNRSKTKGERYFWIYSPRYFEITVDRDSLLYLDKSDDPNNQEAPRLIQKEVGLVSKIRRKLRLGSSRVLKVPNTLNNLAVLFEHPKNGYPSIYDKRTARARVLFDQIGNKRIPSGWVCMRERVVGVGMHFHEQQEVVTERGVVIPQLAHRILFNLVRHAETNTYPDGIDGQNATARTSTRYLGTEGENWPFECRGANPSGLGVGYSYSYDLAVAGVGVAVALPTEVQANHL